MQLRQRATWSVRLDDASSNRLVTISRSIQRGKAFETETGVGRGLEHPLGLFIVQIKTEGHHEEEKKRTQDTTAPIKGRARFLTRGRRLQEVSEAAVLFCFCPVSLVEFGITRGLPLFDSSRTRGSTRSNLARESTRTGGGVWCV